jgi:hypothetical protein
MPEVFTVLYPFGYAFVSKKTGTLEGKEGISG